MSVSTFVSRRRPDRASNSAHRAIVGLALMGLVACADTGTTILVEGSIEELEARWTDLNPTAEQMSSFAGDHRVGDIVSEPLTIRVRDRNGRGFSNLTVNWTVNDLHGGVSLSGDSVFTSTLRSVLDANGVASVQWRLGHEAGTQRVSVRVSGPGRKNKKAVTADFELTAVPGEPMDITLNPDAMSVEEGENALASAFIEDEYGNEIPDESYPLVWQSMNSSVAAVDDAGIVSAIGEGSTIVTVAAGFATDSTMVSVTAVPDTTTPPDLPPNTPTVSAFVVGGGAGSLRIVSSAFSGNGGSHDATAFQVDTAGGDFSSPQYHDVVLGAVLTETIAAPDPGSVVVSRVRHRSDNGEWSAWSDSRSTTIGGAAAEVHFGSEWERSSTGLTDAEQLAGGWGVVTGRNVGPASRIVDSDAGLVGRGDYFRVNNSGTNSRQVQTDQMVPASTTHWGRVYVRSNNTTSRHNHTIAIGSGSGHPIEFAWGFRGEASGSVPFVTVSGDFNGNYPGVRWWASDVDNANDEDQLEVDEWYLVEWQIEYLADPTHYRVALWIHEADDTGAITLENKWVTSDFYESDQPGTGRTLTEGNFGISSGGSPDAARRYSFGNEGPAGGASDSGYMDFASFAISLTGRLRATVLP